MGNATTLLFGLPTVAVETVSADDNGARTVHVVTDDATAAACPSCGVFSTSVKVKQYRTTRPKDLPYGEAPRAPVRVVLLDQLPARAVFGDQVDHSRPLGAGIDRGRRGRRVPGLDVGAAAGVQGEKVVAVRLIFLDDGIQTEPDPGVLDEPEGASMFVTPGTDTALMDRKQEKTAMSITRAAVLETRPGTGHADAAARRPRVRRPARRGRPATPAAGQP